MKASLKTSFLKSIFLWVVVSLVTPLSPVLASDGYWRGGHWCSQENNYCSQTNWGSGHNNYDRDWNRTNYYYPQPMLESIEYNGRIIRTGIRPGTRICPLVRAILGHCDGYIGFDENTRTHIFVNSSNQQYHPNNQGNWDDLYYNQNKCVVRILGVGLICPQVW